MNLMNDSPVLSKPRTIRWSLSLSWRRLWANSPRMLLVAAALLAAALVILVPAYLVIRTVGAGRETLDLLTRASTLQTLLNTIVLAVSVTLVGDLHCGSCGVADCLQRSAWQAPVGDSRRAAVGTAKLCGGLYLL